MSETAAPMHGEQAQAKESARETICPVDGTPFAQKKKWQRFCSPKCRNTYHGSMTPEALRRDIENLKLQATALRQSLEAEKARTTALEARVQALDTPVQ